MERIGPAVFETWSKNRVFGLGLGNFGKYIKIFWYLCYEYKMYFYCPICILDFASTQSNLNVKISILLGVLCNYLDMTTIVRMTHLQVITAKFIDIFSKIVQPYCCSKVPEMGAGRGGECHRLLT